MNYILRFKDIYYWKLINKNNKKIYIKENIKDTFELYISPLNININNIEYWYDIITNKIIGIKSTYKGLEIVPSPYTLPIDSLNEIDNIDIKDLELYTEISNSLTYISFYCDLLSNIYDIEELPYEEVLKEINSENNMLNMKLTLTKNKTI